MIFDLPEPRDNFLGPEIARDVQRIASVRARMEESALTAEVIKVLRDKGYTVTPPADPAVLRALAPNWREPCLGSVCHFDRVALCACDCAEHDQRSKTAEACSRWNAHLQEPTP